MALPTTHCTEGSAALEADSWAFLSPCFKDMPLWKKTGQATMEINLNLLSWCVNTSESSRKLRLPSPNISAPAGWLCTFARDRAFCSLQESPNHSAGSLSQSPIASLGVHFWWEGWRGQNGTGLDKEAEVGHSAALVWSCLDCSPN